MAQKAQLPLCPFPLKKEKKSVTWRAPKTSICFTHHGKAIKTLSNRRTGWLLNRFLYFKGIMSKCARWWKRSAASRCCWNREVWIWVLWTFFLYYVCICCQRWRQGNAAQRCQTGRRRKGSELKSVYLRARRPEEAALTCVNDLLGTEEGDFHCNNRSCIVLYPL